MAFLVVPGALFIHALVLLLLVAACRSADAGLVVKLAVLLFAFLLGPVVADFRFAMTLLVVVAST